MAAIRLDKLRKTYHTDFWKPSFEAVKGISLEVHKGESFVGTAGGIYKTRSMHRKPIDRRWLADQILNIKGTPWKQ